MMPTTDPAALERLYALPTPPAEPWGLRWRQRWRLLLAWLAQPALEVDIAGRASDEIGRRLRVQRLAYAAAHRLRRNAPADNREILAHMMRLLTLEASPTGSTRTRRSGVERKG